VAAERRFERRDFRGERYALVAEPAGLEVKSGSQRRELYDEGNTDQEIVEISVADNGSGLAPEIEEHLF
jgi:signal transduction histidine kinase